MRDSRLEELKGEGDHHLTAVAIGEYLDGDGAVKDAEAVRGHLDRCRRCFALYAELLQTRIAAETGVGLESAPPDLVAAGLAVGDAADPAPRPSAPPRKTRAWLAALPVGALAVFAVVFWLTRPAPFMPPPDLRTAVAGLGNDPGSSLLLIPPVPGTAPRRGLDAVADPAAVQAALTSWPSTTPGGNRGRRSRRTLRSG